MLRSIATAALVTLIAGACVTVDPGATTTPTIAPSGAPSLGIATPVPPTIAPTVAATPTAAPTPTAEVTLPPTAEPTVETTPEPTLELTPEPTVETTESPTTEPPTTEPPPPTTDPGGPPTRDLLFFDSMTDPTSGWLVFSEDYGTVAYADGSLDFKIPASAWAYSGLILATSHATLRPIAEFQPVDDGTFGLFCGTSDNIYLGVVLATDGSYAFIRIEANAKEPIFSSEGGAIDVPVGGTTLLGLQCTALADGTTRLEFLLGDNSEGRPQGPIAIAEVDEAISSFDRMAIYGEGVDAEVNFSVPQAGAYGLGAEIGLSEGAQLLLTHVPTDWQDTCAENPIPPLFAERATYALICQLQTGGDGAELAEYVSFDVGEDMFDAYQARIDAFGVASEGSCTTGPHEMTWSIEEVVYGRVQCAPQAAGIRFDWTDERLNFLSTLIDFDGDYPSTYAQWLEAGPNV